MMKRTILTVAVLAFLMGGMTYSASAHEVSTKNATEIFAGDNWDKILDEYEKYVDQYIKVYKKAMNGDKSALNEYLELAEKAQKLAEQLEDAEDELTETQMKRYLKITQKMLDGIK
ncbi:MAG: hypothetical protein IK004_01680 [Bacteroidales bacterium]|nr:hypothetical protein [Bacteroidales bacterium]